LLEDNPAAAKKLRREAVQRGVDAERLICAPRIPSEEHLARHRLADLSLDTLPYNAHTTACDALWAGLPIVTCMGSTFVGRVAASVLNAVGLPELVTHTLEDYAELAVGLARDPAMLSDVRARLARNLHSYPLFNTERFCRHMEAAYVRMWERAERGDPPASFAVDPLP
jgi:protein O-GlcNAc transferase